MSYTELMQTPTHGLEPLCADKVNAMNSEDPINCYFNCQILDVAEANYETLKRRTSVIGYKCFGLPASLHSTPGFTYSVRGVSAAHPTGIRATSIRGP